MGFCFLVSVTNHSRVLRTWDLTVLKPGQVITLSLMESHPRNKPIRLKFQYINIKMVVFIVDKVYHKSFKIISFLEQALFDSSGNSVKIRQIIGTVVKMSRK